MRPGKIFRPTKRPLSIFPVLLKDGYPAGRRSSIYTYETFFVVSVELNKEQEQIANYHDLRSPWVVLYEEKIWIAETYFRSLMDLTPWPPWSKCFKHNSDLLEDFKHYVR